MNRLGLVIPLLWLVTPVRAQESRGAGSTAAGKLGFVAMPPSLVKTVRLAWSRQLKGPDGKPLLGAD